MSNAENTTTQTETEVNSEKKEQTSMIKTNSSLVKKVGIGAGGIVIGGALLGLGYYLGKKAGIPVEVIAEAIGDTSTSAAA